MFTSYSFNPYCTTEARHVRLRKNKLSCFVLTDGICIRKVFSLVRFICCF